MHVADNARLENRKSSNGRKIARMARILTIFGPKRSQRPKLFHEKKSNERNEQKVPEKFEKLSIFFSVIVRMFRELFVRLVRSKNFHQTAWVAAIFLVRISSKSEPSSRFFGRLKIFNFWPCIIYFTR